MTNSTIGWCDNCKKEVGYDHDCTAKHNLHKLVSHFTSKEDCKE